MCIEGSGTLLDDTNRITKLKYKRALSKTSLAGEGVRK
jgi:hypothetical protein